MNRDLNVMLIGLLTREHPDLVGALEDGLRSGAKPGALMDVINEVCLAGNAPVLAGLVWAFLVERDPDFRRREEHKLLTEQAERGM